MQNREISTQTQFIFEPTSSLTPSPSI